MLQPVGSLSPKRQQRLRPHAKCGGNRNISSSGTHDQLGAQHSRTHRDADWRNIASLTRFRPLYGSFRLPEMGQVHLKGVGAGEQELDEVVVQAS